MKDIKIFDEFAIVDIDTIKPDPQNAKIHNEKDIADKIASIRRHGFVKPIVVTKTTMTISAGNGMYLAAQALGLRKIPVLFTDHSELLAKSYGLADNLLSDDSQYNLEQFNAHIKELHEFEVDMDWSALGFDDQDINLLLTSLTEEISESGNNEDDHSESDDISEEDRPAKPIKVTNGQRSVFEFAFDKLKKELGDYEISEGKALELICANYNAGL